VFLITQWPNMECARASDLTKSQVNDLLNLISSNELIGSMKGTTIGFLYIPPVEIDVFGLVASASLFLGCMAFYVDFNHVKNASETVQNSHFDVVLTNTSVTSIISQKGSVIILSEYVLRPLADLFTISDEQQRLSSLKITFIGRIRSCKMSLQLIELLLNYPVDIHVISTEESLMDDALQIKIDGSERKVRFHNTMEALSQSDVLYLASSTDNHLKFGTKHIANVNVTCTILSAAPPNDISEEVLFDPRFAYSRQVKRCVETLASVIHYSQI